MRQITCAKCGEVFEVNDNRVRKLCKKCARDRGYQCPVVKVSPLRNCHDCHKPTTDYRCPKCLAKWQARNNVNLYGTCEEGWEEMAC